MNISKGLHHFERICLNYERFQNRIKSTNDKQIKRNNIVSFLLSWLLIGLPTVILISIFRKPIATGIIAGISAGAGYFLFALLHPPIYKLLSGEVEGAVPQDETQSSSAGLNNSAPFIDVAGYEALTNKHISEFKKSRSLEDFSNKIIQSMQEIYNPKNVAVFMLDNVEPYYRITASNGFTDSEIYTLTLLSDNPIVEKLHSRKMILVKSNLSKIYAPKECRALEKEMEYIRAEICLPLSIGNGVVFAIIAIGAKNPENAALTNLQSKWGYGRN